MSDLLTPEERDMAWKAACGDNTDLVELSYPDVLLEAQLAKVRNKPLPTDEEIHIKIVDCLFGELSVPKFREWLKERFR